MNFWNLPISARLIAMAVLGCIAGCFINWAIYQLAYFRRPIGPWSKLSHGIPRRTWADCIPVYGWWRMRREIPYHKKICIERLGALSRSSADLFWVRPMLIELFFPLIAILLYLREISGGLLPSVVNPQAMQLELHGQFVNHFVLLCLMMMATFIDFDELTIPDWITTPGTLLALLLASLLPGWHLFYAYMAGVLPVFETLHAASPRNWPVDWNSTRGLYIGLGSYWLWCLGLADRRFLVRVVARYSLVRGIRYYLVRVRRSYFSIAMLIIWMLGTLAILFAYNQLATAYWQSLLTSLIGIAVGGLIVWSVRIVAGWAMGREALGFGDVTLMAMVGAFLGWQPVALAFGFAPLMALIFVVVKWIITGDHTTPYGPYLCAAVAYVVWDWNRIFNGWAVELFALVDVLGWVMAACLILMGILLWLWQRIKYAMARAES